MSSLILLFFFVSFYLISSTSSFNITHKCSAQQTHALLLFKQNLSSINSSIKIESIYPDWSPCKDWLGSGYNPIMMNWNTITDCCDWNGVTCDELTGDVIGLDLSCGMLQGIIHPNTTLFHLPHLQRLNLAFNNFTYSQLPPHIGRVSNSLTHLNISRCGFVGQVPNDISHLHRLVSLDLSWNSGYFRLEPHVFISLLQNLTVMEELSLTHVDISSSLPANLNISSSSLRLLDLGYTGLQGKLPHSIFKVRSLEKLDLRYNSFTGYIPSEISHLTKLASLYLPFNGINNLLIKPHIFSSLLQNSTYLRDLWLSDVNISSVLPTYLNISSSLRLLDLSYSSLQGKLPQNILNLKFLEELDLSGNSNLFGPLPKVNTTITSLPLYKLDLSNTSLSGEIPTSIGHLNSLVYLDLSNCGLNGSLPESLGNLRYLKSLYLSSNMLSGALPHKFSSLQSLKYLSLGNNQLTGKIDVQTFQQLANLSDLDLSSNHFKGEWELDTLLSSLTNLYWLDLSYSGLSVTNRNANHYVRPDFEKLFLASCGLKVFPVSSRTMKNLRDLDLSNNDIHGHIPDWVGEIGRSQLYLLNLSNNSITGTIPASFRAMKNLFYLDLSNNDIHGHIPDWVGEIGRNQLSLLDLSKNLINGTIPDVFEEGWGELEGILLNGNRLEGKVPNSLQKCQNLKVIDLGNNNLNDTFPGWLEDLPELQVLVLRSNKFHGVINVTSSMNKFPFPSLRVLDLSHNGFVGKLNAKYFQNFNAMKNVVKKNTKPEYLSFGDMYYSISVAVKGVDQVFTRLFVEYTIVDLSRNKFEGEIPNIMGNLNSLKVLNLSHNSLTGRIPQALGKLSEIESLDLSWNQLTGEIPQSLANLTSLGFLNLSHNHLLGRIPQGKQFNTFGVASFGGNPKLCGFPLPKKCSEPSKQPQPEGDDDDESGFTWKVVVIGFVCGTLLGFVLGYFMLLAGKPKWFISIADATEDIFMKRHKRKRY